MTFDTKTLSKVLPVFVLSLFLLSGIFNFRNYGISWDEPIQRKYGHTVLNYVTHGDKSLFKSSEKYYGPVFELFLAISEKILNTKDLKTVYTQRHLLTFLFNFLGTIYFYKLLLNVFGKYYKEDDYRKYLLSIFGLLSIILSPRIFAHTFYNTKDLVSMSSLVISFYYSFKMIENPDAKNISLASLFTAISIDIRLTNLIAPMLIAIMFLMKYGINKILISKIFFYGALTLGFIYLFWPILWENPIKEAISAFNQMKTFPETSSTIFLGRTIPGDEIPWYFIPTWIGITIPMYQVILFLVGITIFLKRIIKKATQYQEIMIFGWWLIPYIIVLTFKSNLYDGWRQMFFIYPGIILTTLYGMDKIICLRTKSIRYIAIILIGINLAYLILFMYKYNPHQNVYFNLLAGKRDSISSSFSRDYWGLVYKQLYEYIESSTDEDIIKVYIDTYPGEKNVIMSKNPNRFEFVNSLDETAYYLTNYRGKTEYEDLEEVHTIIIDGFPIGGVYKSK